MEVERLVDQGEERAAGVLVQMFGAGEPYGPQREHWRGQTE